MTRPFESAFPWVIGKWTDYEPEMREGMTKRELFAALICAGLSACPECTNIALVAKGAVNQADALIAALNNTEGSADA